MVGDAKLKRENESLKKIIGQLVLEKDRGKKVCMVKQTENKTQMAKRLGIGRSSLYYKHRRPAIDEEVKNQIEAVLTDHPAYGHKRIALALKLNKKRILRVMKKYKITPYRKPPRPLTKKKDLGKPATKYENLIENLTVLKPDQVWCCDFTYIKHQSRFIYLATMVDLYTKEIVGFNISRYHNRFLVIGALLGALGSGVYQKPDIVHSDQGSEYDSKGLCRSGGIYLPIVVLLQQQKNTYEIKNDT